MILVLNCGSTSVKYALYSGSTSREEGAVTGITDRESMLVRTVDGVTETIPADVADHDAAIALVVETISDERAGGHVAIGDVSAVGHRVVHGGDLAESRFVDEDVKRTIEQYAPIAPLHNPVNLAGIEATEELLPDTPQVAVFDTAFHQTMPPRAFLYALPYELYEAYGIRKYGFHGISHEFVATEAAELLEVPFEESAFVTCHLGGGCSMAAIRAGRSIDTTMGFTPLEGLIMATRTGDIDPTVVRFLIEEHGFDLEGVFHLFNHESGFAGLSGIGDDLEEVIEASEDGDERAELAVEAFSYRIRKYVGAYAAVLGDLDGIVFTAGIGENAAEIRKRVCDVSIPDLRIDDAANDAIRAERGLISGADSDVPIAVVPTDEELMIARETDRVVSAGRPKASSRRDPER